MKASVRTLVYTGLLVVLLAGPAGIARAQQLNWTLDPLDPNDPLAQPIIYAANKDLTVLYGMYGTLNSGSLFRWTEANGFTNIIGSAPTYNVNYVSYTRPVSDDGLKLIVFGPAIGGSSVYTWTEADGLTHIAAPSVTHTFYNAVNISGDGSAFALTAMDGSNGAREAFHWRDGVGLTNLGSLGGTPHAVVYDINYDGSVIVGNSMNAMVATEAFIWKEGIGMTGLGLMGGVYSDAIKVSDDGRFVAGYTDTQVFRWEDGGNVEMLSFAPGNYGFSESMTRDGRYIIGYEADGVTSELFGFRWDVDTNDYTLLGGIAGSQSYTTPTEISDDGGVIIGETYDLNTNIPYNFYWSEDTGFKTFEELLTDAGVDLTGWLLHGGIYPNPAFLSADGTKIVAMGYKDFTATSYIMTLQGITTPQDMAQDFIPATSAGRQVTNSVGSGLGQSLLAARQALPSFMQQQARASYGSLPGSALIRFDAARIQRCRSCRRRELRNARTS
jgi:probable HAF family extracellular repeat protein